MGEPTLLAWVPALVALGMVIIIGRKQYLRAWIRSALHWRVGLKWWIIAIFGVGGLMLIAIGLYVLFGNEPPNYVVFREELWLLPLYFLINIIFGSIGEELGWRGYILPQLQKKYGPVISSVIIGLFWGFWHLPMFFNPTSDKFPLGLIFIIPYTFGCIGNSLIMTWIYNKTRESALLGGIIWHAALNFWTVVLLVSNFSILAASSGEIIPRVDAPLYYILEILFIIVGLILIFMTKGQLGREIERN